MNMPPRSSLVVTNSDRAKLYKFPNNSKNNYFQLLLLFLPKCFVNMSALSVLYLVLPFVGVFALHEVEETVTTIGSAGKHRSKTVLLPIFLDLFTLRFSEADKRKMWITAVEQLLLLVVITEFLLNGGSMAYAFWIMAFGAYSLHVLIHLALAVAVKGYYPGLVTAVLSLPFVCYGLYSISLVLPWGKIVLYAITGATLAFTNLMIVDSLSTKIMSKNGDEYHR